MDVMFESVVEPKKNSTIIVIYLTSHMPLLASIKNSVSESILSLLMTSSELLDCLLATAFPD